MESKYNIFNKILSYYILIKFYLLLLYNENLKIIIQKTALHIAIENQDAEIVNLLLSCHNIDVNIEKISFFFKYNFN